MMHILALRALATFVRPSFAAATCTLFAAFAAMNSFAQTPLERAQAAMNTPHPGKAIYDRVCATCHDNPETTRSPSLSTLKAMRFQAISFALTQGKMQTQAASLSNDERNTLIEFLVGREAISDDW